MSKIGKAFMSLILDKKAREALQNAKARPAAPKSASGHPSGKTPAQSQAPAAPRPSVKARLDSRLEEVQNRPQANASPSRQQLLQNAKRVRATKQDVFDDLSEEQRQKLQVLAMKAMMPKGPGGRGG